MQWEGRASFTQGAAKWLGLWLPAPRQNHSSVFAKTGVFCIKGHDTELWLQKLCLVVLLVSFTAFEISFDLWCGTNVAFGSAQSCAIWQPLCTSLLRHLQGWMKHGFYCYSLVQLPATFSEAKKVCEENKGYLATVRDRYGNNSCPSARVTRMERWNRNFFLLSSYS